MKPKLAAALAALAVVLIAAQSIATRVQPGMVLIPAGAFAMGDHQGLGKTDHGNDELPVHNVRLDSFQMAATDVTAAQYAEYLNDAFRKQQLRVERGIVYSAQRLANRPYAETSEASPYSPIAFDGASFAVTEARASHPMVCVRWEGAAAYCNWRSERAGLAALYDTATWACDFTKPGFRLPTEAEWEYAARGGLHQPYRVFPWGDEPDPAKANWPRSGDPFERGPEPHTTPVAYYPPNGYGLYDMAGNVWQWTNDWYARDYYRTSPEANPTGPERGTPMPDGKPYRVVRGGSWYNGEYGHSRVSNRNPAYYRGPRDPDHPYYAIGFRPVFSAGLAQAPAPQTVGLFRNEARAFRGYTLFAPKHNLNTYLMDNEGRIVRTWKSAYEPGQSVYLLPNGHLLRACMLRIPGGIGGGEGGRLEEYDWDGHLVWEFEYANREHQLHHDIKPLPNGNILAMAVERKSAEQCKGAGFDPDMLLDDELSPDYLLEIQRTGPKSGNVVWEWHVWDHLVQDFDKRAANYGDAAAHPELIDVHGSARGLPSFWNHFNSLAYNPKLDQIVISVRGFNEIWVIDHGTTTAQAASHKGGRAGKGGDLLYRWGNPAAYQRGAKEDRKLFQQHDAQWIPDGYPGAGHLLIFNNGLDRGYSSVDEIVPPVDAGGRYRLERGKAFGPAKPVWTYEAQPRDEFYSAEISGAHRLPNGNTLICAGVRGLFFEVTPQGEKVWEYGNPVVRGGILAQGERPGRDQRGHFWNAVFKIHRYEPEYPAFRGRTLTAGNVLEQPAALRGKTGFDNQELRPEDRGKKKGGKKGEKKGDKEGKKTDSPPPPETASRFQVRGGIVTDPSTGLQWERVDGGEMTWERARQYCAALSLDNHGDWRLPSTRELFSIADQSRPKPAIDTRAFAPTEAEYWWTSEPRAHDPTRIWVVNAGGGAGPHPKRETVSAGGQKTFHARCVRGPALPLSAFADNGDGTLTDRSTGLIWQKSAGGEMDWQQARDYARQLKLRCGSAWRLPTIHELQTLHDPARVNPSLHHAFPDAAADEYWSGTSMSNRPASAWTVDFSTGIVSYGEKTETARVRAVCAN